MPSEVIGETVAGTINLALQTLPGRPSLSISTKPIKSATWLVLAWFLSIPVTIGRLTSDEET